jgi:hypothetical protein
MAFSIRSLHVIVNFSNADFTCCLSLKATSIPSKRPQKWKNNFINCALRPRRKVSPLSVHTVSFSLYNLQLLLRRANLIFAPFEFKPSPSARVQFQYIELERFSLFQRYVAQRSVGRESVWQWLAGTRWENTRECAWPPAPALCAIMPLFFVQLTTCANTFSTCTGTSPSHFVFLYV